MGINRAKAVSLGFAAVIFAFALANLVCEKKDFSEQENRYLASFPELSVGTIADGSFMSGFESWANDHFVLRDFWVGAKADIELMLNKCENNGVYLAKGGYLIERVEEPDADRMAENAAALESFASESGIPVCFALIPGPACVLRDRLPLFASSFDEYGCISRIYDEVSGVSCADIAGALASYTGDRQIFYRTDHHWTMYGAYLAYSALGGLLGFEPYGEESFEIETASDSFYGSMYSKSGIYFVKPDSIELWRLRDGPDISVSVGDGSRLSNSPYFTDNLSRKDKYTVYMDGNHALEIVKTTAGTGRSLLVVKDSYAHPLVALLACHYDEIYMVDLRYYNSSLCSLVDKYGIDQALVIYSCSNFASDGSVAKLAG